MIRKKIRFLSFDEIFTNFTFIEKSLEDLKILTEKFYN